MTTVATHSIFTTHTPVPAGNDAFDVGLIDKYFGAFYPKLGISREKFLQLANDNGGRDNISVVMAHVVDAFPAHKRIFDKILGWFG